MARDRALTPRAIRTFLATIRGTLTVAAQFPVDVASERAVHAAILEVLTADVIRGAADSSSLPSLQLRRCAESVLRSVDTIGVACTPAQLSVAINTASHGHDLGADSSATKTFISPLIQEREVDGERGYYAREDLPAGTLIIAEAPSLLLDEDNDDDDEQPAGSADFASLVAADVIGRELLDQRTGLRVANGVSVDAPGSKGAANAASGLQHMSGVSEHEARSGYLAATNNGYLSRLKSGSSVLLLFARISILNHACWPNCSNNMSSFAEAVVGAPHNDATRKGLDDGRVSVYTVRRVAKGEELTVTYEDANPLPKTMRVDFLQASFHFVCGCERCTGIDDAGTAVDERLQQMLPCAYQMLPRMLHEARTAHASLFMLNMQLDASGNRRPSGFQLKPFPSWQHTRTAAEAAIEVLSRVCASAHWMLHMAQDLRCRALEALAEEAAGDDDAKTATEKLASSLAARGDLKRLHAEAFSALAEYASAHVQLVPRYSAGMVLLAARVERARLRADAMTRKRVERAWRPTLDALKAQETTVSGWLNSAGAS